MNPQKRKYFEIEEDKVADSFTDLKKMNTQNDQTINELKKMIDKFETERLGFIEDHKKLGKLYDMGVIDSNGDLILFLSEKEDEIS